MSPELSPPRREDLPDGSVRIHFAKPILHFGEAKMAAVFRPPTAGEFLDLGDPRHYVYDADGFGAPHTDRALLRRWAALLIVGHDIDMVGREADPMLGMLIEEAILDFFANARRRLKPASAPSSEPA